MNAAEMGRVAAQLARTAALIQRKAVCACCGTVGQHAVKIAQEHEGKGRRDSGPAPKGSVSDPTGVMALSGDSSVDWHRNLTKWAKASAATTYELEKMVDDLGQPSNSDPKDDQRTGQGDCAVCDTFCSGAAEDRLKGGYCHACYMAWSRAGRPDRQEFRRFRRQSLEARNIPA